MGLKKRGQSLLEYSILFAVILSALLIMQFYIQRGYQGRLKAEADSVGQQYSPGHTTSLITTTNKSATLTQTENGIRREQIGGYIVMPILNPTIVGQAESTSEKSETVDSFSREW